MGYGIGTGATRPVRPVAPRAPVAPRPDNRGGPLGAAPAFPSLASPGRRPAAPTDRGVPTERYTNDQVTQSLAHNPQAAGSNGSFFAYQGQPQAAAAVSPPVNPAPVTPVAPNVSYDYNADPILAQTRAITTEDRGNANADALAARKRIAIDYNDPTLADSLGDPATAAAARNNPFGVLEQLKRSYGQGAHNLDEQLNNQNLFYGSYRTDQQGNLAHDYQGQQAGAAGQEGDLLGGVGKNLRDALLAADRTDADAKTAAAANATGAAVANGVDPGVAGPAVDPIAAALSGAQTPAPAADTLPGAAPAIDYSLASTLFPTPNTDLVNPAAFGPTADTLAAPSVPNQPDLAGMLFPTAGTPLLDPSAFAQQPDPLAAALAGLTPQRRRQAQFVGA